MWKELKFRNRVNLSLPFSVSVLPPPIQHPAPSPVVPIAMRARASAAVQLNAARALSTAGARFGRSALLERVLQELKHEEAEGQPPAAAASLGIFTVSACRCSSENVRCGRA